MSDSSTSGFLGGSLSGQEGECRQEPIRGHPQGKSLVTAVLAQAAWAAKRKKHSYLKAQHYRLVIRRGKKRAIFAVDHTILIIAYDLLKQKTNYQDLGEVSSTVTTQRT